jgi:bifunctional DNA-binding transcriptional regulator/antitoxin component of YhaV-PrlF toxin-antitoxin module
MANPIYKVLGKRGRITIPFEIRQKLDFCYNDIVSFKAEENSVIVKREKLCNKCRNIKSEPVKNEPKPISLLEFLDGLTLSEQRAALIHLSMQWAKSSESVANKE